MSVRFLLLCVCALVITNYSQQCLRQLPQYQKEYVSPIIDALSENYTVYEGTISYVYNASNRQHPNPGCIYGFYSFPTLPDYMIPDPSTGYIFFHPSDAIIYTGCIPPSSQYFSVANYLMTRYNANNSNDDNIALRASLGDSINHLVINASNIINSNNHPFDEIATFIHTGDQQTFNDINHLYKQSILNNTINLGSIPSEYFYFTPYNYSLHSPSDYNGTLDSFRPLFRIVKPFNMSDVTKYTAVNQTAYVISLKNGINPITPYSPDTKNTSCGYNESFMYLDSFNEFIKDTINYFENMDSVHMVFREKYELTNYYLPPDHHYGFECIDNLKGCIGDNRDEQYYSGYDKITDLPITRRLENDSFFIVVGVNHYNTKQTVYDELVLYENMDTLFEFDPGEYIDNSIYNGSCLTLPINTNVNQSILTNFYMAQITRPQNCISELVGFCLNETQFEKERVFIVSTRHFLNPVTFTRPDRFEIVPSVVLTFKIK